MPPLSHGSGPTARAASKEETSTARLAFEGLRRLAREAPVEVLVHGDCMAPAVIDGATVRIASAPTYWPGDVLAFRDPRGRILLHRLLGWRLWRGELRWVTAADAAIRPDPPLCGSEILGRLRGGQCDARLARVPLRDRIWAVGRFSKLGLTALRRRLVGTSS